MSKFGNACMRGVDHVTGSIEKSIDTDAARLTLENTVDRTSMVINISPSFFFTDRGSVLSLSEVYTNCGAIGMDYGFNKFTLG